MMKPYTIHHFKMLIYLVREIIRKKNWIRNSCCCYIIENSTRLFLLQNLRIFIDYYSVIVWLYKAKLAGIYFNYSLLTNMFYFLSKWISFPQHCKSYYLCRKTFCFFRTIATLIFGIIKRTSGTAIFRWWAINANVEFAAIVIVR